MRSPQRSCPRTSTRSACASLMELTAMRAPYAEDHRASPVRDEAKGRRRWESQVMSAGAPDAPPVDPGTLIASRDYRGLLVLAALIGILVSLASWGFLEGTHQLQTWLYKDLPGDLGFS